MNKNIFTWVLLCLSVIALLGVVALSVDACASLSEISGTELTPDNAIGGAIAVFAVWGGFLIFSFSLSAVGFFASMVGTKLARTVAQKTALYVLMYIHAIIAIVAIFALLYFFINA